MAPIVTKICAAVQSDALGAWTGSHAVMFPVGASKRHFFVVQSPM